MDVINVRGDVPIIVRQVKFINNIAKQDHQAIKRDHKPIVNFTIFRSAKSVQAGIEMMHMIRKVQLMLDGCKGESFADQL